MAREVSVCRVAMGDEGRRAGRGADGRDADVGGVEAEAYGEAAEEREVELIEGDGGVEPGGDGGGDAAADEGFGAAAEEKPGEGGGDGEQKQDRERDEKGPGQLVARVAGRVDGVVPVGVSGAFCK